MEDWQLEIKFWDQVFPALPYAFQRSQEIEKKYGYNDESGITAKSVQVYCRTEQILQKETREVFNKL